MKKKLFFSAMLVIVLVFGMTVIGCDLFREIDPKFHGKWELESLVYGGETYTLPCNFQNVPLTSGGYEIGATTMKTYINEVVLQDLNGLYSDGNSLFNSAGQGGMTLQLNGNKLTIITALETDHCRKVSKFSWE